MAGSAWVKKTTVVDGVLTRNRDPKKESIERRLRSCGKTVAGGTAKDIKYYENIPMTGNVTLLVKCWRRFHETFSAPSPAKITFIRWRHFYSTTFNTGASLEQIYSTTPKSKPYNHFMPTLTGINSRHSKCKVGDLIASMAAVKQNRIKIYKWVIIATGTSFVRC